MKFIRYKTPYIPTFTQGALLDEVDRLFQLGLPALSPVVAETPAEFPLDVYRTKDSIIVRSELPGFRREDINVEVADNTLTLSARFAAEETKDKAPAPTGASVRRVISLPKNLDYAKVSAAYENGVLTVTLPRREETKPRTVAVEIK